MTLSLSTEELNFDDVVGMLKAHEMELEGTKKMKGVALTAAEKRAKDPEVENAVGMLVRRFDRALRRVEQGQKKTNVNMRSTEADRPFKKADTQCHECKW